MFQQSGRAALLAIKYFHISYAHILLWPPLSPVCILKKEKRQTLRTAGHLKKKKKGLSLLVGNSEQQK